MKFKTTQKEIKNNYSKIIVCGHCQLNYLLRYESPEAYTCGVYGWNADIYDFGDVAIVTGYRPFGDIECYELCKEYDAKAEKLVNNYTIDYDKAQKQIKELLKEFIEKATK